jgi:hypothetical protein
LRESPGCSSHVSRMPGPTQREAHGNTRLGTASMINAG